MPNETELSTLAPTEYSFLLGCAYREPRATEYKIPVKRVAVFTICVMHLAVTRWS